MVQAVEYLMVGPLKNIIRPLIIGRISQIPPGIVVIKFVAVPQI